MAGQIKFLNLYGDITIEWDDKDNLLMEKIIAEKLAEGYQFFIVKKSFGGLISKTKKLKSVRKLKENKILIKDKDVESIFEDINSARIIEDNNNKHEVVKASNNVNEISKSNTVCTKPPQAG